MRNQIGDGIVGVVFRYRNKGTDLSRAVRKIPLKKMSPKFAVVGLEMLRLLDHRNIVKIFDIFQSERKCYIVMQYASGGNLREALVYLTRKGGLNPREPKWVGQVIRSCLLALSYCRSLDPPVIHGNLKPENILLLNSGSSMLACPHAVLCDFTVHPGEDASSGAWQALGTPGYTAPEVWDGQTPTCQSDMFSLGCVVYYCQAGQHAFSHPRISTDRPTVDMLNMHQLGPGSRVVDGLREKDADWSNLHGAGDLARSLLVVDPGSRWEPRQALRDAWIMGVEGTVATQQQISKISPLLDAVVLRHLQEVAMLARGAIGPLYRVFTDADKSSRGLLGKSEFVRLLGTCGVEAWLAECLFCAVDTVGSGEIRFLDCAAVYLAMDRQSQAVTQHLPAACRQLCPQLVKESEAEESRKPDLAGKGGGGNRAPQPGGRSAGRQDPAAVRSMSTSLQRLLDFCAQKGRLTPEDLERYVNWALSEILGSNG
mmetsp:Transcript_94869/g.217210  ORF Transcript_94869/g.217210 Transcript_94869/m.217210 type:complete len:484 (+) Transcript_94869:224-1675(+)